jgi:cell division protein FtsQ
VSPAARTPSRPETGPVGARGGRRSGRRGGAGRRGPVLAALAVTVAVLAAAVWVVGFTGVLGVRTVSVAGVGRVLTADQVRSVAAVPAGQPLARVDTGAVAARVRALAGVARVAVSRSWPSTVRIVVTERRGVAVVRRDGAGWLVDRTGVVFQRHPAGRRTLPLLEVPAASADDPSTRAALRALTALPPEVAKQVTAVRAPTPESVTLALTRGRTVLWGGTEQPAAKATVLAALLRRPGTRYDISTPSVVTVR